MRPEHHLVVTLHVVIRLFADEIGACASIVEDRRQGCVHAAQFAFERLEAEVEIFVVEDQHFIEAAELQKYLAFDYETSARRSRAVLHLHCLFVIFFQSTETLAACAEESEVDTTV